MRRLSILSALILASLSAQAHVLLPTVFGDGMVLQRDAKLPVWGWGTPGEAVTVELAGKTADTTVGANGQWRADLPPIPAGGPHTLVVKAQNTIEVKDVLVGEVWLCSGQSNMEFPTNRVRDGQNELASANHPRIRLFHIPRANRSTPQRDVDAKTKWQPCTPDTVAGFSAVGYLFGHRLQQDLDVPVGLIESAWGGTRIEPWTPPAGFAAVPRLAGIARQVELATPSSPQYKERLATYLEELSEWRTEARRTLVLETFPPARPPFPPELSPLSQPHQPTALYNGMINPIVPFAIRGAIWYQGEANRGEGPLYVHKMKALVQGWREVWQQGEFPFYFAQLAPFRYGGSPVLLPNIWEAQAKASIEIPNAGMAVINDIGNLGDIHPTNKQDVADRLARLALARTYGKKEIICDSPRFAKLATTGGKAIVQFADVHGGLKSRDGKPLTTFELVDAQQGILPAAATITALDTIEVTAEGATQAVGVRFAWDQCAEPNLANGAGLPAGAFRAGQMPPKNRLEDHIPAAKGFTTLYTLDIPIDCGYSDLPVEYATDNSQRLPGAFDRLAYCLELKAKDKPLQYVFVAMDPFTRNTAQLGVPTAAIGKVWQQDVHGLSVASNVADVPVGTDLGTGNLEFWPSNYGPRNERPVQGADNEKFDFGDSRGKPDKGHGSMQIHLPSRKATLFGFNRWGPKGACELGIGNAPTGQPDWTFASNAASYELRRLTVLVRIEE